MVTTRHAIVAELRARFAAAKRMPQYLECRDQAKLAMRQVSDDMDAADNGNGSDSDKAELGALFDALKSLISQIDDKLQRAAVLADLETRQAGIPLRDGTDRDYSRARCEFSILRACGHAIGLHGIDAGRELEVQQEMVRRAKDAGRTFTGNCIWPFEALSVQVRHLSAGQLARVETRDIIGPVETRVIGVGQPPGTTGGSIVGTYTDPNQYIDVLRPAMAVRQAGARVLSDLTSNLRLPRMSQSAMPGWVDENSPIPTADEQFDDITMTPHHDGVIVTVTRNVLQQSNPEIEAIVRNDTALRLANDVDRAAIAGTGVAPQPLGIVTDPLVPTLTAAPIGYDATVDMLASLATNNALMGSLAWIGDATVMQYALKSKDLYGRPYADLLWHGYPTYWTNLAQLASAPTDPLVFGNWSDLIIGFWSELDILVNPYADSAYSVGNVQIRAMMTLDLAKRHPVSWVWQSVTGTAAEGSRAGTESPPTPPPPSRRASA